MTSDQIDDDIWRRHAQHAIEEWAAQRQGPATSIAATALLIDLVADALRAAYERGYIDARTSYPKDA